MIFTRFLNCANFRIYTTLEPKNSMLRQIPQPLVIFLKLSNFFIFFKSENAYDLSKFLATILCSQVHTCQLMNLSVLITLTHLQRFWKKLFKAHQNPQEFKIISKILN